MSQFVSVEREIGGRLLRFETGKIARLASASVTIYYADSAVLTAMVRADPRPGLDFFPLQCDYRERMGAGGKFPGGFRKREGAPAAAPERSGRDSREDLGEKWQG